MAYVTKGQKADYELIQSRIDGFFPDFAECRLTIGILLVHPSASNPEKPPLMRNGFPVNGDFKKSSYEDRVQGKPDATLKFAGPVWSNFDDEEKAAEADHWLSKLIVARDKDKVIKTDDFGRPMLKNRPHDKEVCVYDEVVRRHGRKAPEAVAIEELSLHYNTLLPPDANTQGQEELDTDVHLAAPDDPT